MPSQYRNVFRTNLFFEQVAARLATLADCAWGPWTQPDGSNSFHLRGSSALPAPAELEIWSSPGPNQPNLFTLQFSQDAPKFEAANAYFEMRHTIHNLLDAGIVHLSVDEEVRATLDAERENLDLDNQNLRELPSEILVLRDRLTCLSLRHNRLTTLPAEFTGLTELVELDLAENRLESLPPGIGALQKLEVLLLSENRLSDLPPEIGQLTSLRKLDIDRNRIEHLPASVGNLQKLRSFNVSHNLLTRLPGEFLHLDSLRDFDLEKWSNGPKKSLPPRNVRNFIAVENPWIYPPAEIVQKGLPAIRQYMASHPTETGPAPVPGSLYTVYVDDNYHHMDQTYRYKYKEFSDCGSAIAACRTIVDEFFRKTKAGKTAEELFGDYKAFGEDPFIMTTDPNCRFSAWKYAEQRSKELAPSGKEK